MLVLFQLDRGGKSANVVGCNQKITSLSIDLVDLIRLSSLFEAVSETWFVFSQSAGVVALHARLVRAETALWA
jgi:hypothetical protein